MPRKPKNVTVDVNKERAANYAEHFSYRQYAKAHPDYAALGYKTKVACDAIRGTLGLSIYGGPTINGLPDAGQPFEIRQEMFDLARLTSIPHWKLYWWYWSDEGWEQFQMLWQNLPEVVHMVVPNPLCTSGGVIHICTHKEYVYPTDRRKTAKLSTGC